MLGKWKAVPSTGKSSNSSSSSSALAVFDWSFMVEVSVGSEFMALVVGPEPSAAADMIVAERSGGVESEL